MPLEPSPSSAGGPPDLDEFLGALDGFLSKETPVKDPSYFKFLGIFCRSIGAAEGNLLKRSDGRLGSILSFGMGHDFDRDFNEAAAAAPHQPSPLHVAYQKKEVIAIVDLAKDPDLPPWFRALMDRHGFGSLVAVPLIGRKEPTGVLCAYYHDVCLFDQGTLNHLYMIGRMVGAAAENDQSDLEGGPAGASVEEALLGTLTSRSASRAEIFSLVAQAAKKAVGASGSVSGPVRNAPGHLSITVAGLECDADASPSQLRIPAFLEPLVTGRKAAGEAAPLSPEKWGDFRALIGPAPAAGLAAPMIFRGKLVGLVAVWRSDGRSFGAADAASIRRLAAIAALALTDPRPTAARKERD